MWFSKVEKILIVLCLPEIFFLRFKQKTRYHTYKVERPERLAAMMMAVMVSAGWYCIYTRCETSNKKSPRRKSIDLALR